MQWADVDWEGRTVSVQRQPIRDRRTQALSPGAPKAGVPNKAGEPIEPRNYNRGLSQVAARAGVERVSSHRLRHSYASWAFMLGVNPGMISRALRHSQISTTMRYSQATVDVIREGDERFSELLG